MHSNYKFVIRSHAISLSFYAILQIFSYFNRSYFTNNSLKTLSAISSLKLPQPFAILPLPIQRG